METFSALLALCAGNSTVPGEFPTQRPVTRSVDVFFDLCLNKRLSKQSWGWWFETPSRSLWCHCNAPYQNYSNLLKTVQNSLYSTETNSNTQPIRLFKTFIFVEMTKQLDTLLFWHAQPTTSFNNIKWLKEIATAIIQKPKRYIAPSQTGHLIKDSRYLPQPILSPNYLEIALYIMRKPNVDVAPVTYIPGDALLTWANFNPSMDK